MVCYYTCTPQKTPEKKEEKNTIVCGNAAIYFTSCICLEKNGGNYFAHMGALKMCREKMIF